MRNIDIIKSAQMNNNGNWQSYQMFELPALINRAYTKNQANNETRRNGRSAALIYQARTKNQAENIEIRIEEIRKLVNSLVQLTGPMAKNRTAKVPTQIQQSGLLFFVFFFNLMISLLSGRYNSSLMRQLRSCYGGRFCILAVM